DVDVHIQHADKRDLLVAVKLMDSSGEGIKSQTASVPSDAGVVTIALENLASVQLWTLDNPALYHVEVTLLDGDTVLDMVTVRCGFREAKFKDDGFYLNGEPLTLIGLNRHQTFPYIGAAAPERLQRKDADIIKYELSCNLVRTSHYP